MTGWLAKVPRRGLLAALALVAATGPAACGGDAPETAATTTAATPAPAPPRRITIAATGELLPHPSVVEGARAAGRASGRAYDFAPLFVEVAPLLAAADLAICHLEVPVAPQGTEPSGYPDFGIPADIGDGIRAGGWDRCSTASNHSNDRGRRGIVATLDALDAAGVGHSGTARTEEEAVAPPVVDAGGVRVAHLASTWGFNGSLPAEPWMAEVTDPGRLLAAAARARAAGAEIVVVSIHWGVEYQATDTAQRALAERLLASPDVDLIVGHGPHVLQGIEERHGKWVLFSLGNLVANQGRERPATYDGAVVEVAFTEGADGRFSAARPVVHPTWYDRTAWRVRLVEPSLADPALAGIAVPLQASLDRTTAVLGPFLAP